MAKGVWKKGWFWGVVGSILILTVPAILLAALGIPTSGQGSDGNGGIRAWSFGFFFASNNISVNQSSTSNNSQTIIHQHGAPPREAAKKEAPPAEEEQP